MLVYLVCSRRKLQCISSWDGQHENNKLSCACVALWWKFVAHGSHFYLTKDNFNGRQKKAYIHWKKALHTYLSTEVYAYLHNTLKFLFL